MDTPDPSTPSPLPPPKAEPEKTRFSLRSVLPLIPYLLVLGASFFLYRYFGTDGAISHESPSIFKWLFIQYHDRDMQLTWVMPLVSLFAVWTRRESLAAAPKRISPWGFIASALILGLHVLAFRSQQPRVSLFTTALFFWASAWALWGWAVAKQLLFALGYTLLSFLCFHIKHYTTSLQVLASSLSVVFLKGFGVAAYNVGSVLHIATDPNSPPIVFNVIEGCSGLRSLVVLTALAAPFAYFQVKGNLRAWILFALSVPLAVLTNILRISTLTAFAFLFGNELAMQVYHDPAGFLVFFIGILLLKAAAAFLERDWASRWTTLLQALRKRFHIQPRPTKVRPSLLARIPSFPSIAYSPARAWILSFILIALIGGTSYFLSIPRVFTGNPTCPIETSLPDELGPYTGYDVLFCTNDQCVRNYPRTDFPLNGENFVCPVCSSPLDTISIGERKLLPENTPILRHIYSLGGNHKNSFQVSIVYSGAERNSIHRPQRCLVSQGHQIISESTFEVPLRDGSSFPIHLLDTVIRYKNDDARTVSSGGIYAYWYFNPERYTPDHFTRLLWIAHDNIFRDYRPRWAYASVSIQCDSENREPAYELLRDVVPRLIPIMEASQQSLRSFE